MNEPSSRNEASFGGDPTSAHDPQQAAFPIVGIGASAGGLEALGELFSSLPEHAGMAFLIVQHLHPGHASLLVDILGKKTAMPVVQATEGLGVEQDHVYVIPPNTSMTIAQRRLSLTARNDKLGPPMPIDDLLDSLAQDQASNAIGVILSGGGSDGALGMQAIKREGGITFAQDEASAHFSTMPRAAIGLGCIDLIMQPGDIARELARIGQHLAAPPAANVERGLDDNNFARIFPLLRVACDVDFSHYKLGTMKRRLARRLALLNIESLAEYVKFVEANPAEAQALCQDFLIRVTSFFRDPESFEGLIKTVFPRLLEQHPPKTPLRIWVAGCASGEEVYSIAICLLEFLGERASGMHIQIFGTDVSEAAIETARAGRYIENIARDVSPERLQRFFVRTQEYYQVIKPVRDLCIFATQNVTRDPPFSRLDLVSCRNLLIYLDPVLQRRVIPLFHYALSPWGVLMLGPAESIGSFSELFGLLDSRNKTYTKKPLATRAHVQWLEGYPARNARQREAASEAAPEPPAHDKLQREADRIALARYVPAAVLCDEELNVVEFRGDTAPYLMHPSGPPSRNLRDLARPALLVALSNTIQRARRDNAPVRSASVRIEVNGEMRAIALEVMPLTLDATNLPGFLIFFEVTSLASALVQEGSAGVWAALKAMIAGAQRGSGTPSRQQAQTENALLKRELAAGRDHIRTINEEHDAGKEELRASQEELLSSNEEFQSTNEELETAKEELQSTNEELTTTNDELRHLNRELKELNAKVAEARDYADAIVETVNEPLLVLDHNLRIVRANTAFDDCFKTIRGGTEGGLIYEVADRSWDNPALRARLDQIVAQGRSFRDYQVTQVFPTIGNKTMRISGTRLHWAGHALILLAIADVTDRENALSTLKESDRRKDEFLAMLAHELRNPLAAIRSALELWQRGDAGAGAEQRAQTILKRQLQKQVRLVDDLLDLSRISSGIIALQKTPHDLVQTVQQALETTQAQMDSRQHQLVLALPNHLMVDGDATRLDQVITNLLSNAAKYTNPGGRIELTLAREGQQAVLTVIDNGIGIVPALLPVVFDLFVQAERSLDRVQGGLGVGLTLVRRIVELHGGSVEARSAGAGQGSTFIVRLPASLTVSAPSPTAEIDHADRTLSSSRRILIVDDNADSAESMEMLLQLEGHEVQIAVEGYSAIEMVATFRPDVVLLDIGLPGMDGYDVARQLRKLPHTKALLLIAHSGYGGPQDRLRSKEAGFDHHVVKPATLEQITALIGA